MSYKLKVGDLVENGDLLGRITRITKIKNIMYGTVNGHRYALSNLVWVPDPETIREQSQSQKLNVLEAKRRNER